MGFWTRDDGPVPLGDNSLTAGNWLCYLELGVFFPRMPPFPRLSSAPQDL
jgi:hypothetical protein